MLVQKEAKRVMVKLPPFNFSTALCREDYEHVSFWYREDWDLFCKNNSNIYKANFDFKSEPGLLYIQLADGRMVDNSTVYEMDKRCREIFARFLENGKAAKSFDQLDTLSLDVFYEEMKDGFPFLSLCHGDWKAEMIGTAIYPLWQESIAQKSYEKTSGTQEEPKSRKWFALLSAARESTPSQSQSTPSTKRQRRCHENEKLDGKSIGDQLNVPSESSPVPTTLTPLLGCCSSTSHALSNSIEGPRTTAALHNHASLPRVSREHTYSPVEMTSTSSHRHRAGDTPPHSTQRPSGNLCAFDPSD